LRGTQAITIKGLHGKVPFVVQRLLDKQTQEETTCLALTGQFEESFMSPALQELAAFTAIA